MCIRDGFDCANLSCYVGAGVVFYVDVCVWVYALYIDVLVILEFVLVLEECSDGGAVYVFFDEGLAVERQCYGAIIV